MKNKKKLLVALLIVVVIIIAVVVEIIVNMNSNKEEEPKEEKKTEPTMNLLGQDFTLDEYKLMVKILKEEKEKEQIKQERKTVEENPLTELNKLYQSISD